jgi:GNAT superfamily N-acetyltransferase
MGANVTAMTEGWRLMTADDPATVSKIAAEVHVDYPEDDAVFAERLALFAEGCRIAELNDRAVGYALFHPGVLGRPPRLNTLLGELPPQADCLYLHDVALLPAARGHGFGLELLNIADDVARRRGLPLLALTATPQAAAFWLNRGFRKTAAEQEVLACYGPDMRYMTRSVQRV